MYGVYTVVLAGKSPNIRSHTVYIYGSGQLSQMLFCVRLIPAAQTLAVTDRGLCGRLPVSHFALFWYGEGQAWPHLLWFTCAPTNKPPCLTPSLSYQNWCRGSGWDTHKHTHTHTHTHTYTQSGEVPWQEVWMLIYTFWGHLCVYLTHSHLDHARCESHSSERYTLPEMAPSDGACKEQRHSCDLKSPCFMYCST